MLFDGADRGFGCPEMGSFALEERESIAARRDHRAALPNSLASPKVNLYEGDNETFHFISVAHLRPSEGISE